MMCLVTDLSIILFGTADAMKWEGYEEM